MIRLLALALLLAGCAPSPPVASEEPTPPPVTPSKPLVVAEADRTQEQAARFARDRDDLSNADLIQMLRLSADLKRAVQAWRAHRTPGNTAAVRTSIQALRTFMRGSGDKP